jgi:hypothetical protein
VYPFKDQFVAYMEGYAAAAASRRGSAHASRTPAADGDGDVHLGPVRCFSPNPVCGADWVTYGCDCSEASGVVARVAPRGYCEVGAGTAPVSDQRGAAARCSSTGTC